LVLGVVATALLHPSSRVTETVPDIAAADALNNPAPNLTAQEHEAL
jgi:hypothetical protein